MIRSTQNKKSAQAGQGMTEYIIVLSTLVFTFLAPVTPPSVPDWSSDGLGSRQLQCPLDPYNTGAGRSTKCTVIEILGEVLRKRNDGYSYAISSTFYPERYVTINPNIFGDPDDPGTGNGDPGDPGGSVGDPGDDPDTGVGSDTGITVAVNDSGEMIGSVDDNGCVINDDGVIIGQQQPDSTVLQTDASCNVQYTDHRHDSSSSHGEDPHGGNGTFDHSHSTVIGQTGSLQTNGDILNASGKVIGNTSIG